MKLGGVIHRIEADREHYCDAYDRADQNAFFVCPRIQHAQCEYAKCCTKKCARNGHCYLKDRLKMLHNNTAQCTNRAQQNDDDAHREIRIEIGVRKPSSRTNVIVVNNAGDGMRNGRHGAQ